MSFLSFNILRDDFNVKGNYDASTQYYVMDVVRAVVSSSAGSWILMIPTSPGIAPSHAADNPWARLGAAPQTGGIGPQGLPAPHVRTQFSDDATTWRDTYVLNDPYKRESYDGGNTWTPAIIIRGERGRQGEPGIGINGIDGVNAPLVIWQYASEPETPETPVEWRNNYVRGDVWKRYSNNNGLTWGPAEYILAKDGRDGEDLQRQYADAADGPWEVIDHGQPYVRERIGNIGPFGPPFNRTGDAHVASGLTREQVLAIVVARYTDVEKTKLAGIEDDANRFEPTKANLYEAVKDIIIADIIQSNDIDMELLTNEDTLNRIAMLVIRQAVNGITEDSERVANGTLSVIQDGKIALHTTSRGYSISDGTLQTSLTQGLFYGFDIELVERAGARSYEHFVPYKRYGTGLLNDTPIIQGSTTFNVRWTYRHEDVTGHDEIELTTEIVSGTQVNASPFFDAEVYEINLQIPAQQSGGGGDGQTAEQVSDAIQAAVTILNTRIDETESDIELNEQSIGNNEDNIRTLDTFARTRASNDALNALDGRVTSIVTDLGNKADTSALNTLATTVQGKQDIRPVELDIDPHYVVRGNRIPVTFQLELRNIVASLLPSVDNLRCVLQGQVIHSENISLSPTDQSIHLTLDATEAANLANNIRSATSITLEISFRNGSTDVHREQIPLAVVDAPPVRPQRDILAWNPSRATTENATLPTNYASWQMCKIVVAQTPRGGTNTDTIIIFTQDLARGNLTNFGRGNNQVNWNSTTRVLAPESGARLVTVALL